MNQATLLHIAWILVLPCALTACARNDSVDQHVKAGLEAQRRHLYVVAEESYFAAIKEAEKSSENNNEKLARSLSSLGVLYYQQKKYSKAEPLLKRALAVAKAVPGSDQASDKWVDCLNTPYIRPDPPKIIYHLDRLIALYRIQNRRTEVESLLKQELSIQEKATGSKSLEMAEKLNTLANFYYDQGDLLSAEPLLKQALSIEEERSGLLIGARLNDLAILYRAQGKYAESDKFKALAKAKSPQIN